VPRVWLRRRRPSLLLLLMRYEDIAELTLTLRQAMRFPPDAHKKEIEGADERRERLAQEQVVT
jgi:hypothetical protein